MPNQLQFDVVIVGAGPAGLAAGLAAGKSGKSVAILDENVVPGGQIYRGAKGKVHEHVSPQLAELAQLGVTILSGHTVMDLPTSGTLVAMTGSGVSRIGYQSLILATGARELFLPFPGWTLPNVMGVGGLQALVKAGLDINWKRVVVAGTGPLLLTVGAYLKQKGAKVILIAEQAERLKMFGFLGTLIANPAKAIQGAQLLSTIGPLVRHGKWVERAEGKQQLESVTLHGLSEAIPCDYLACAYGFVPNVELPMLLGCEVADGFVKVDRFQLTTIPNIYCAGEPTGIGGIECSVVEGSIAGYAATGQLNEAKNLFGEGDKCHRFGDQLAKTFALRPELKALATPETIVCRCEDVTHAKLVGWESSRAAKLHTRCGMGPCQGRICGPATSFLLGWEHGTVRSPLVPTPLSGLELEDQAVGNQPN